MASAVELGQPHGGSVFPAPVPPKTTLSYTRTARLRSRQTKDPGALDNLSHVRLVHSAPHISSVTQKEGGVKRRTRILYRPPSDVTMSFPQTIEETDAQLQRVSPRFNSIHRREVSQEKGSAPNMSEMGRSPRGTRRPGGNLHIGRAAGPTLSRGKVGRSPPSLGLSKCEAVQIVDMTVAPITDASGETDPKLFQRTFPSKPLRSPAYATTVHKGRLQNGFLHGGTRREGFAQGKPHPTSAGRTHSSRPLGHENGLGPNDRSRVIKAPSAAITDLTSFSKHGGDDYYRKITAWQNQHQLQDTVTPGTSSYTALLDKLASSLLHEEHPYARRNTSAENGRATSATRMKGTIPLRASSSRHSRTVHFGDIAGIQGQNIYSQRSGNIPRRTQSATTGYFWHPDLSLPTDGDESTSGSFTESDNDLDNKSGSSQIDATSVTKTFACIKTDTFDPGRRQRRRLEDVDVGMVSNVTDGVIDHAVTASSELNSRPQANTKVENVTYNEDDSPSKNRSESEEMSSGDKQSVPLGKDQPLVELDIERPDIEVKFDESLYSGFQHRRFTGDGKAKRKQKRKHAKGKNSKSH